jgi:hypothetical protein
MSGPVRDLVMMEWPFVALVVVGCVVLRRLLK